MPTMQEMQNLNNSQGSKDSTNKSKTRTFGKNDFDRQFQNANVSTIAETVAELADNPALAASKCSLCSFKTLVQLTFILIALSALITITLYNYLLIQSLREGGNFQDVKLFTIPTFGSSGQLVGGVNLNSDRFQGTNEVTAVKASDDMSISEAMGNKKKETTDKEAACKAKFDSCTAQCPASGTAGSSETDCADSCRTKWFDCQCDVADNSGDVKKIKDCDREQAAWERELKQKKEEKEKFAGVNQETLKKEESAQEVVKQETSKVVEQEELKQELAKEEPQKQEPEAKSEEKKEEEKKEEPAAAPVDSKREEGKKKENVKYEEVKHDQNNHSDSKEKHKKEEEEPDTFGMGAFTTGKETLIFPAEDTDEISFSAWIYMPEIPLDVLPAESKSIKTVASTKASGCIVSEDTIGWSLFIHEWGTLNQQLRLSWTSQDSACIELSSEVLVSYNRWQLVGFSLSQSGAMLFIGKKKVADTQGGLGSLWKQGADFSNGKVFPRMLKQSQDQKLYLGGFKPEDTGMHGFMGYMLDARLVAFAYPDNQRFYEAGVTPLDDLINNKEDKGKRIFNIDPSTLPGMTEAADLNDKDKVNTAISKKIRNEICKLEVQFGANAGVMKNRLTKEKGEYKNIGTGKDALSMFQAIPYFEKPDTSWIKTPAGLTKIKDITDLEPRATLSDEEIRATWPDEWKAKFSDEVLLKDQREADGMAETVRREMVHCWRGYKSSAWGMDEVRPVGGGGHNWVSIGITILDCLDTLWLMGLTKEFAEGEDFVDKLDLSKVRSGAHSLFEITIRALGGLLSAHSLSMRPVFLEKAKDLGKRLLRAFSNDNPIPRPQIDLNTGQGKWMAWSATSNIAEAGTLQMEFRYLSTWTKERTFWDTPDKAFLAIVEASEHANRGLVPINFGSKNPKQKGFTNSKISLGAMGDSYYEYLIKQYIQGGKRDDRYKKLFIKAMNEMMDRLVVKTRQGTVFIAEETGGKRVDRMDHLVCFVPGMLLLGLKHLDKKDIDDRWFSAAEGVTECCYKMYKLAHTGLSPEYVKFDVNGRQDIYFANDGAHNLLRPEAIEAIYYMWYYTGDPKYRKWATEMFMSFKKWSKSQYGYTALRDVRNPAIKSNQQESFFMAETMKYFYLIFAPRSLLNHDEFIITTEAHPLRYPIERPGVGEMLMGR